MKKPTLILLFLLTACMQATPYGCKPYDNCTPDGLFAPTFNNPLNKPASNVWDSLYKDDPQNNPQNVFKNHYIKDCEKGIRSACEQYELLLLSKIDFPYDWSYYTGEITGEFGNSPIKMGFKGNNGKFYYIGENYVIQDNLVKINSQNGDSVEVVWVGSEGQEGLIILSDYNYNTWSGEFYFEDVYDGKIILKQIR